MVGDSTSRKTGSDGDPEGSPAPCDQASRSSAAHETAEQIVSITPYLSRKAGQHDDDLPQGHNAQVMLFTGVQIVRSGTQG